MIFLKHIFGLIVVIVGYSVDYFFFYFSARPHKHIALIFTVDK